MNIGKLNMKTTSCDKSKDSKSMQNGIAFQSKLSQGCNDSFVKSTPLISKKSGIMAFILGFLGIEANRSKVKPSDIDEEFENTYLSMAIIHDEKEKNEIRAKYNELINIFEKHCKNEERKELAIKILEFYKSDLCLDNVGHGGGSIYNIRFSHYLSPCIGNLEYIMHNYIHKINSKTAPSVEDKHNTNIVFKILTSDMDKYNLQLYKSESIKP